MYLPNSSEERIYFLGAHVAENDFVPLDVEVRFIRIIEIGGLPK